MREVAIPVADPQSEFHRLPDPGSLIQGFLIRGPRRGSIGSGRIGRLAIFGRARKLGALDTASLGGGWTQ